MINSIGLPAGTVAVYAYTSEWARLFEEERARLHACIGAYVLDIQHVGSTSVPGLPAKPILDIGIAVENFEEAFRCIPPLEQLAYLYRGELGIPRRHYFTKGEPRTHHLHMTEITSTDWRNTIAFRDYLRRHPDTAAEYAALKQELALQFPADRSAYLAGKAEFIQEVLNKVQGYE